jgi:Outer membrane protein beta-barrel domain
MLRKLMLLAAIFALFSATDAAANVDFGLNIDWSKTEGIDNGDWGVGSRVDFGGQFRGMIAFDYYFTNAGDLFDEGDADENDFDLNFFEFNGNILYEFPTDVVHPYLGGGVGFARRTFDDFNDVFDDERTELGLNVFGGLKFGHGIEPFIEVRGTFYPDDEGGDDPFDSDGIKFGDRIVVTAGILF